MPEQEKHHAHIASNTLPERIETNPEIIQKGKGLKGDLDKLMNEIDEVLEENAEEFIKGYVQRSGE